MLLKILPYQLPILDSVRIIVHYVCPAPFLLCWSFPPLSLAPGYILFRSFPVLISLPLPLPLPLALFPSSVMISTTVASSSSSSFLGTSFLKLAKQAPSTLPCELAPNSRTLWQPLYWTIYKSLCAQFCRSYSLFGTVLLLATHPSTYVNFTQTVSLHLISIFEYLMSPLFYFLTKKLQE